jgi:hypothetical protein
LDTFTGFTASFRWMFTLGLALSCGVDILITGLMCYLLNTSRSASSARYATIALGPSKERADIDICSTNDVISTLMYYTMENGSVTTYVGFPNLTV